MALDPGIILSGKTAQIEPQSNALARLLQIQGMQNQNEAFRMRVDQDQRSLDDQNRLRQLLSQSDPSEDPSALAGRLTQGGFLPQAQSVTKTAAENAKSKREAEESGLKSTAQRFSLIRDVANGINSPESWARGVARLRAENIPPEGLGQSYDPAHIAGLRNEAVTKVQEIEQALKERQFGQTQQRDEAQQAIARGQLGIAGGHLQVARDRLAAEDGAGETGGHGFTPEAIVNAAARYNIDGTLPAMGMGKGGSTARAQILNKAAELAAGSDPDEQRIAQIGNKANAAALSKIQQQQTMVGAFEKNFVKNADLALALSDKVDRTGSPIINKWINAGKRATGDADVVAFDQAIKSASNEYAKIISGSMGNTAVAEGEIRKMEEKLNAAQTVAQVNSVIALMKKETQNRMEGFDDEKRELRRSMTTRPTAAPDKPAEDKVRVKWGLDAQGNPVRL